MKAVDSIVWFQKAADRYPARKFFRSLSGADRRLISDVFCTVLEMKRHPALYSPETDRAIREYRIRGEELNHWMLTVNRANAVYLIDAGSSQRKEKAPAQSIKEAFRTLSKHSESVELPGQEWLNSVSGPQARRNDIQYLKFRLGVYFREIRHSADLTQKQVSEKTGVATAAVSEFENHARDYTVGELADYLSKLKSLQY